MSQPSSVNCPNGHANSVPAQTGQPYQQSPNGDGTTSYYYLFWCATAGCPYSEGGSRGQANVVAGG